MSLACGQRERWLIALCALALLGVWLWLFLPFLPDRQMTLGHDYAYFLPRLLAGNYWFQVNGLSAIPYFTPALCGGLMFYTNPQDMYFSLPQALSILFGPLAAVRVSVAVFALLGLAGWYLLMRRAFDCDRWSALLAAGLFLFNGFYAYRMLIGHFSFHAVMLLPWIAWGLLASSGAVRGWRTTLRHSIVAVLCSAYVVYAGGAVIVLPLALSIGLIVLLHGMLAGARREVLRRLLTVALVTPLLAASKLVAVMATLDNLQRSAYPLPGLASLGDSVYIAFKSVFISAQYSGREFVNMMWWLGRHEFEYGVSIVPLLVVLLWLLSKLRHRTQMPVATRVRWLPVVAVVLLLSLPVLLNLYHPALEAWIKTVPVLKSSSSMVRWYLLYIPAAILLTALLLRSLHGRRAYVAMVVALMAVMLTDKLIEDRSYYAQQSWSPQQIVQGDSALRKDGVVPAIERISASAASDAVMVQGVSRAHCYEPMFGYRLEFLPAKEALKEGDVMMPTAAGLNMKNPACYSYPEANDCAPGAHFSPAQAAQLDVFRHYRPYDFALPWQQRLANVVSLITLVVMLLVLLAGSLQSRGSKS